MESKKKSCPKESHGIDILNFWSGEEVPHSVVVIQGLVKADNNDCQSQPEVVVKRIDGPWSAPAITRHEVAANLNFKCILKLERGVNTFLMKYCSFQREFMLCFRPRNTPFRVVPLYIICKGHDGRFEAPACEENSIDSACERIDLGLRIVQSMLAEKLKQGGYGRQTFQLQSDLDPKVPEVQVFYSAIPVKHAHSIHEMELWAKLGREIMRSHLGSKIHKFVGYLSSTRFIGKLFEKGHPSYNDIIQCTDGHAALAGGGFALIGTPHLHTWASSIEEVVPRLNYFLKKDTALRLDDSNFRKSYAGLYCETLGTTCHELSHTFDVGHSKNGIMAGYYSAICCELLPKDEKFINRNLLPASCPQEEMLALLRSADGVHDLRITPKEACSSTQQTCQSSDHRPQTTDAHGSSATQQATKLVQELKVAWSVSEQRPQQRIRVPSIRSPTTDPRSQLPLSITGGGADSTASATEPLDLSSIESSLQDDVGTKTKRLRTSDEDNIPYLFNPTTPDYFDPSFASHDPEPLWSRCALAFIAYCKWINPNATEEKVGKISYDKTRRHITSTHGLRVVELRGPNATSILYWKFSRSTGLTKFTIPELYFLPNLECICIIDSIGNVLKFEKKTFEPPDTDKLPEELKKCSKPSK